MNVRLADENDIEEIVQILKNYRTFYEVPNQDENEIREFVKERLAKSDSKIFIAVDNKKVLGIIQLYPYFSTISLKRQWILNDFYVEESERTKGIGTALMNAVTEYFKDTAKGFLLVTDKTNAVAKKFYSSYGWKTDEYDIYTYYPELFMTI